MRAPVRDLGFLSDIDGLRAVAVVAVVLFHLRVPGFEGGYVGVDIFFVISGFLISGLLRSRIEAGVFSFSSFYANRVRRLIPAVIATVVTTAIAALWILQPQMLKAFAASAIASLFSVANLVFFSESGYWDANSDLKPLLHMWSLGVEEQFYLFWPALLLFLTRRSGRLYLAGLVVLMAVSFAACVTYTDQNEAASFYLLPFRVWQFCLGALAVEVWRRYPLALFSRQLLRATGLALCGVAIASFGEGTVFPGWIALIPSAGAAFVLMATDAEDGSPWLSNRLAAWLGKISYSLYLVHWPPIALYRCYTLKSLDVSVQIALGVLTLLLAVALHFGIETRFYRRHHRPTSNWRGVPGGALALSAALSVGLLAVYQYPSEAAQREVVLTAERIEQYKRDRFQLVRRSCRVDQLDNRRRCPETLTSPILFIGNSHEPDAYNALWAALAGRSENTFVNFGSINGCGGLTIFDDWVKAAKDDCQERVAALYDTLNTVDWDFVVYSALRYNTADKEPFLHMLKTIKTHQPTAQVMVFSDYVSNNVECGNLINQFGTTEACKLPQYVRYFGGAPDGAEVLRSEFEQLADYVIDKVALLCTDGNIESCIAETPEGAPMYVDEHHLTFEFASFLGQKIADQNPEWLQRMRNDRGSSETPPPESSSQ